MNLHLLIILILMFRMEFINSNIYYWLLKIFHQKKSTFHFSSFNKLYSDFFNETPDLQFELLPLIIYKLSHVIVNIYILHSFASYCNPYND